MHPGKQGFSIVLGDFTILVKIDGFWDSGKNPLVNPIINGTHRKFLEISMFNFFELFSQNIFLKKVNWVVKHKNRWWMVVGFSYCREEKQLFLKISSTFSTHMLVESDLSHLQYVYHSMNWRNAKTKPLLKSMIPKQKTKKKFRFATGHTY